MQKSKMDRDCVWGTEIELFCFAHVTKTCVFSYSIDNGKWNRYGLYDLDRHLNVQSGTPAVYLLHPHGHYDVVILTETVGLAIQCPKQKFTKNHSPYPDPNGNIQRVARMSHQRLLKKCVQLKMGRIVLSNPSQ